MIGLFLVVALIDFSSPTLIAWAGLLVANATAIFVAWLSNRRGIHRNREALEAVPFAVVNRAEGHDETLADILISMRHEQRSIRSDQHYLALQLKQVSDVIRSCPFYSDHQFTETF